MLFLTRSCFLLFIVSSVAAFATPQVLNNPILFVTQMPIPSDFTTIASTFGNHRAGIEESGRGGDLYIRYTNGTLRNLTQEAGFGQVGFQGATAISVRDPAMHFSGTKSHFQYGYRCTHGSISEQSILLAAL